MRYQFDFEDVLLGLVWLLTAITAVAVVLVLTGVIQYHPPVCGPGTHRVKDLIPMGKTLILIDRCKAN